MTKSIQKFFFFTVATNIYFDYWLEMVKSFPRDLGPLTNVTFVVFTNRTSEEVVERTKLLKVESAIVHVPVENLSWPEATMNRYQLIAQAMKPDVACKAFHIDADMRFHPAFGSQGLEVLRELKGIALVEHPGFFRPRGSVGMFKRFPKLVTSDLLTKFLIGGLGTWERRTTSEAFVQRRLRKKYVAGGFWGGDSSSMYDLVRELSCLTEIDRRNGITPVWHDESYLNKWSSRERHHLLPPSFCWSDRFGWLDQIEPVIEAVTKTQSTR